MANRNICSCLRRCAGRASWSLSDLNRFLTLSREPRLRLCPATHDILSGSMPQNMSASILACPTRPLVPECLSSNAPQQLRWQCGEFQDPVDFLPGESCSRVPRLWRCGRAGGVADDASMPHNMSASYACPTGPLVASASHEFTPAVTRRRVSSEFQDPYAHLVQASSNACPEGLYGESCSDSPPFFLPSCSPRRQPPPQPSHILPVLSCCDDSSSSSASNASFTFPPG